MASIYDLLAGNVPSEQDYLANDPYYIAGRGVLGIQAKPTTSAEAWIGPLLQGLAGGGLMGLGKTNAAQSAFSDARTSPFLAPLLAAETQASALPDYSANSFLAPYLQEEMPEGFTPKQAKADQIMALLLADQNQELAVEKLKQKADMQKALLPYSQIAIEAAGEKAKVEAAGKEAGEGGAQVSLSDLPIALQTKITQAQSLTDEVAALADEYRVLDEPAIEYQPKRQVSGTTANALESKMRIMLPNVIRLAGEVGNLAEQEQARALGATLGNWTSGTEGIADRLDQVADLQRRLTEKQVRAAQKGYAKGGLDNLLQDLSQPASTNVKAPISAAQARAELKRRGLIP